MNNYSNFVRLEKKRNFDEFDWYSLLLYKIKYLFDWKNESYLELVDEKQDAWNAVFEFSNCGGYLSLFLN